MSKRYPSGFISTFYDPSKTPNAPSPGTPVAGDSAAEIPVSGPLDVGGSAISGYAAVSNPGGFVGTSASSPVQVTGLTNGTSYTFQVWALNSYGPSVLSSATSSVSPSLQRALFASSALGGIDYLTISTLGNTVDFGSLIAGTTYNAGACGSTTRGVFAGGGVGVETGLLSRIQYVTFATTGNATSFGDLAQVKDYLHGISSSTRGIFAGGESTTPGPGYVTTYFSNIEYITIATTGNATNFGNLTFGRRSGPGCSSPTRGVFGGGFYGAGVNILDYITIASTGNATDFGDLTRNNYDLAAFSSSTRGVWAGGSDGSTRKQIQYITIASTGNSTNFGDLVQSQYANCGVSSNTRGLSCGGATLSGRANAINYITIASTGNASDFGDMTANDSNLASTSNCHGGVQ